MKIYDVKAHRSYEIDPKEINIAKSKSDWGYIHLHDGAKSKTPCGLNCLDVSCKTWDMIAKKPRKAWK